MCCIACQPLRLKAFSFLFNPELARLLDSPKFMHLSCGLEIDQTCEMVMQEEGTGINPHVDNPRGVFRILILWVGFPTGRDSAIFRDKGTEVPSLSRDKLKILPRDGTACQNAGRRTERANTILFPSISCFRSSFPVLERPFLF